MQFQCPRRSNKGSDPRGHSCNHGLLQGSKGGLVRPDCPVSLGVLGVWHKQARSKETRLQKTYFYPPHFPIGTTPASAAVRPGSWGRRPAAVLLQLSCCTRSCCQVSTPLRGATLSAGTRRHSEVIWESRHHPIGASAFSGDSHAGGQVTASCAQLRHQRQTAIMAAMGCQAALQ